MTRTRANDARANDARAKDNSQVEAYLATLSAESRKALERIRSWIRAAAPEAEEGFSYGVPAFRIDGKPLVCFAAFKNHCGFYPMSPEVIHAFAAELADYDTAKGTIRFQPKKPLPAALVKKIVQARLSELKK